MSFIALDLKKNSHLNGGESFSSLMSMKILNMGRKKGLWFIACNVSFHFYLLEFCAKGFLQEYLRYFKVLQNHCIGPLFI